MLMTGQEYLDSLRDGRRVYIGKELVEDVTAPLDLVCADGDALALIQLAEALPRSLRRPQPR